jgi:hypothetical protein
MFRLPEHQAIINRMGFNNEGLDHLLAQVDKRHYRGVLGINVGKNKDTPNDQSESDYRKGISSIYSRADYITVNVSSPNTPGLRQWRDRAHFNKPEAQGAERVEVIGILVEACCKANRVREIQPHNIYWQCIYFWRKSAQNAQSVRKIQTIQCNIMSLLCRKTKKQVADNAVHLKKLPSSKWAEYTGSFPQHPGLEPNQL